MYEGLSNHKLIVFFDKINSMLIGQDALIYTVDLISSRNIPSLIYISLKIKIK